MNQYHTDWQSLPLKALTDRSHMIPTISGLLATPSDYYLQECLGNNILRSNQSLEKCYIHLLLKLYMTYLRVTCLRYYGKLMAPVYHVLESSYMLCCTGITLMHLFKSEFWLDKLIISFN